MLSAFTIYVPIPATKKESMPKEWDLWKTSPFAQFRCQTQILILEILNVFLWLKSSFSLNLTKIEHFSKVSGWRIYFLNRFLFVFTTKISSSWEIRGWGYDSITLIERKSRMRQIRGVKGEAVVVYCEPLTTKKMTYHRLSRRVNKMGIKCLKP